MFTPLQAGIFIGIDILADGGIKGYHLLSADFHYSAAAVAREAQIGGDIQKIGFSQKQTACLRAAKIFSAGETCHIRAHITGEAPQVVLGRQLGGTVSEHRDIAAVGDLDEIGKIHAPFPVVTIGSAGGKITHHSILTKRRTSMKTIDLSGTWKLWGRVLIASVPAAFVGIVLDKVLEKATGKDIDGWFYNSIVVALALIVYGIAFIVIEKKNAQKTPNVSQIEEISIKNALAIGAFQALSIIPGTSRSGSTILGSMLVGISRTAAAEFSFFMAIPVMVGASGIKALGFLSYVSESAVSVPTMAWVVLLVGCAVSFAVSMAAIRFLMDFVKKHSFAPFGIYRIALGILVLIFGLIRG